MPRNVTFVHTSPAAIPPLMQFYTRHAPDLAITNLLDDGLLRFFAASREDAAEVRLREMLATARGTYAAEAVLITCSAVPARLMEALRPGAGMPLLKIDGPMAQRAVESGSQVGVAVTFAPTEQPTRRLLEEAAAVAGRDVALVVEVMPKAYEALLAGDAERHDRLLVEGCDRLAAAGVDAIVLAQVSMARAQETIERRVKIPVFSSLPTSLEALRGLLA